MSLVDLCTFFFLLFCLVRQKPEDTRMKTGKSRIGTKAHVQAVRERERRMVATIFVAIVLVIILISAYFAYSFMNQQPSQHINLEDQETNSGNSFKAAIVDHLSLTFPNQTFIQTATNILKQTGYTVDYYSGEKVTVDLYRNLAKQGYKLIILRVHSTATSGSDYSQTQVSLFTSERYDKTKYVTDQLADRLTMVAFSGYELSKGNTYFGIPPSFILKSVDGKFQDTVVIMMGCEGLSNTIMAKAFEYKGARAYIGWNGPVTASHTDQVTTYLLQKLIDENQTIGQSLQNALNDLGPDPTYKSQMICYPYEAGEETINKP